MLVDNFRVFIDPARCEEVDLMLSLPSAAKLQLGN
jgi:hypothetical protein